MAEKRRSRTAPKGETERIATRRLEALDLRKRGLGFRDIAAALGVSLGQAYADVDSALAELEELKRATAEKVLELDLARIDGLIAGHYPAAINAEDKRAIGSATVVLRALERRAKLLGLDSPEKRAHDLGPTLADYLAAKYGFGKESDDRG